MNTQQTLQVANSMPNVTIETHPTHLGMIGLVTIVVTSAGGNLLVCLAICLEKRLQNMTNFFLLSLAIADLFVSLLVMPLGMIVEIYGFFPADPYLCIIWVSMDVLLCTASIWHMCTMSMDRFFTLMYPMRYGRNKTKRMVIIKIMIVWCISTAICSPVFIMGFVDRSKVFNNGVCVPTIANFIIYGSVFAFFVPFCIMLVTYVLTVRILWRNQKLVEEMKQNGLSVHTAHSNKRRSIFSKSYSQDESSRNPSYEASDKYKSMKFANGISHKHKKHNMAPLRETSISTKDNTIVNSKTRPNSVRIVETDDDILDAKTNTDVEKGKMEYLNIPSSPVNVGVTSDSFLSDTDMDDVSTQIPPNEDSNQDLVNKGSPEEDEQLLQRNNALLNKRLHEIQREMDQCLNVSGTSDDSSRRNNLTVKKRSRILSDSAESDVDSSSNDIVTVKLKPEVFYMYKLNVDEYKSNRQSVKDKREGSFFRRKLSKRQRPARSLLQSPSDMSGCESGPISNKTRCKRRRSIKEFMRNRVSLRIPHASQHLTRTLTKLLPNRAATNERKASKVLGIIFVVFVVLWTPFFITNVLSGICPSCMSGVTNEVMSTFLWMGYVASLANPIIYTMFNTSFRKAFVKILSCKYSCASRNSLRRQSDSYFLPYMASWQSDRRNTVSLLLDR